MSVVVIDEQEYRVDRRVAELIRKIAARADRLAKGALTLRAYLRGHDVKLTVEEEI
jgi:hypothetical protein